ncbi:hypothetical protein [Marinobacterium litorale]|uniref:hypothetical protein n=1 Tax=Marinobacterium litorale TaxID=404770 RepID=UPI00041C0772|nr:hypothetical protein [Marinobacterium litorale]
MTALVPASEWVRKHPLSAAEIDCIIALKLKILDGKCKMNAVDKQLSTELYQHSRHLRGQHLGEAMHQLIKRADENLTPELVEEIYEHRVLAETMISRPVMKAFKARLREEGLLPQKAPVES